LFNVGANASVVPPDASSSAMPTTPVPGQRRVHFSSATIALGGASETQASSHHSGHQSQSDPQGDDPFLGSGGNIMPSTPMSPIQVCFSFSFLFFSFFLKLIIG
jgi:hypothetical protein